MVDGPFINEYVDFKTILVKSLIDYMTQNHLIRFLDFFVFYLKNYFIV